MAAEAVNVHDCVFPEATAVALFRRACPRGTADALALDITAAKSISVGNRALVDALVHEPLPDGAQGPACHCRTELLPVRVDLRDAWAWASSASSR
jgi:hypothetical protein